MFYNDERTVLIVDGQSLHHAAKKLNFIVDFARFRKYFAEQTYLLRAYYYTTVQEEQGDKGVHIALMPLLDWLMYNGYDVITKTSKIGYDLAGNLIKKGGNMNVEMAIDALLIAQKDIDHVVLVTGDGDLVPLVMALQQLGKRVTVVSHYKGDKAGSISEAPVLSDDLRRQADVIIDIKDIEDSICRNH